MIDKLPNEPLRIKVGNPVAPGSGNSNAQKTGTSHTPSFEKVLQEETLKNEDKLKFSNHAQQRIAQRNINLSQEDVNRMSEAVDKAASKGARESLLLLDNYAFIVSVKNRTVITAVDDKKENIFTNIDSTIIV